ncbi:7126_t:CDS:1, partial [Gigaspora rosea]
RDDELNEDFISNTVEWSRVLDTWFSMIEDEENANQLYYEDDELDTTNSTTSQNLLNTTHPADNQSAKWRLEDLFVTAPHYIIEAEKRETLRKQKEIEFIRDENRIEIDENRIEIDENRIEIDDNNESSADSNNDELMDEN